MGLPAGGTGTIAYLASEQWSLNVSLRALALFRQRDPDKGYIRTQEYRQMEFDLWFGFIKAEEGYTEEEQKEADDLYQQAVKTWQSKNYNVYQTTVWRWYNTRTHDPNYIRP